MFHKFLFALCILLSVPSFVFAASPDLAPDNTSAQNTASPGETISFSFRIDNRDDGMAVGTAHRIYISSTNYVTGSSVLLDTFFSGTMLGGEYEDFTRSITIPSNGVCGSQYLIVQTDWANGLAESNENNNENAPEAITISCGQPDLAPDNTSAPNIANAGETISFSFRIDNRGEAMAVGTAHRIYLSSTNTVTNDSVLLDTFFSGTILANGYEDFTKSVTIPETGSCGSQYLIVQTDWAGGLDESDESNNENAPEAITINCPLPDLAPDNTSAPDSAAPGDTINFSFRIDNRGDALTVGTAHKIFISQTTNVTGESILLDTFFSGTILGMAYEDFTRSITIPETGVCGDWYLIVQTDWAGAITEDDESNNENSPEAITINCPASVSLTVSNVAGGSTQLTGVWKAVLLKDGTATASSYSSGNTPISFSDTATGDHTVEVYYQHDDNQGIWEYWGNEDITISAGVNQIAFTRETPWAESTTPGASSIEVDDQLTITIRVKNEQQTWYKIVAKAQLGGGETYSSVATNLAPGTSEDISIQIPSVNLFGSQTLNYRVESSRDLITPAYQVTDHGTLTDFVTISDSGRYSSDIVAFSYVDPYDNIWEIGVDKVNGASDIWAPATSFENIKLYKNGTTVQNASLPVIESILRSIEREYELSYPNLGLGPYYDTNYNIWRNKCGFYEWACGTALVDFDDAERKEIYKDLIWDAISAKTTPQTQQHVFVQATDTAQAAFVAPPTYKVSQYIDSVLSRYGAFSDVAKNGNDYLSKFLKLNELRKLADAGSPLDTELKSAKSLEALTHVIDLANITVNSTLHAVQQIAIMEYLSATGFGYERLDTLEKAYTYAKANAETTLDPQLELAIEEVKSEFETQTSDLGTLVRTSFLQATFDQLDDFDFLASKFLAIAEKTTIYKSFAAKACGKLKLKSGDPIMPTIQTILAVASTVRESSSTWRRIHLAATMSRMLEEFAKFSNTDYRNCFWITNANGDPALDQTALNKYYSRHTYDMITSFQLDYITQGLSLLKSDWPGAFSEALSATISTIQTPHLYALHFSSTAFQFGEQFGNYLNNELNKDSIKAIYEEFENLDQHSSGKYKALNGWAALIEDANLIRAYVDADNDGMDDGWEAEHFGGTTATPSGDADSDDLTNKEEFDNNTDPNTGDTDKDTMPDAWEVANSLNPLVNDANDDADEDGQTNVEEYTSNSDPNKSGSVNLAPILQLLLFSDKAVDISDNYPLSSRTLNYTNSATINYTPVTQFGQACTRERISISGSMYKERYMAYNGSGELIHYGTVWNDGSYCIFDTPANYRATMDVVTCPQFMFRAYVSLHSSC